MIQPQPPRDWFPAAGGLVAAALLLAGLAYAVFGPAAARIANAHWPLVWVTIVRPEGHPPLPHHASRPDAGQAAH